MKSMNLHVFQHVDFEGPGQIAAWASSRNHRLTTTRFYQGDSLPEMETVDGLFILGGPMNVHENGRYPWLVGEKQFIGRFLKTGQPTLGICLGAQLLAEVLGGKVYPHLVREIGWDSVNFTTSAITKFPFLPPSIPVLHWHGDTYTLPPGARRIAGNRWCKEQAFLWKEQALGLQFHLEAGEAECDQLVKCCGSDLAQPGPTVQSGSAIAVGAKKYSEATGGLLFQVLDHLFQAKADRTWGRENAVAVEEH